ncbi:hypothetical protein TD95_001706 [Thielaviopsis punctulata]|uniref:Exosome complex component RRP45 n=1 Tax=Thielaviopsis punctulata TaxID=72032 RepID=A0A0F4Z8D8_9PEZI|nr:hypothetical protein TD95_001706 [Thielaviopsis punctulata]
MPREAEPSQNEKDFVLQALEENQRLDGRALDQYRPLELSFGDEYGVAEVKFGKTRVLARVASEVTVPYSDRPFDGVFTISTEFSPMVSPAYEVNRPNEGEMLLSRILEKTVRRSGALDTESLCLIAGQKCWAIRVDVHVLSNDGNIIDAACLAMVAALRHFRRPDTSIEGGVVTVYTPAEREPVPLSWLHSPLTVTFGFYGAEGKTVVLDATAMEEQLRESAFCVSLNKHGEVCHMIKIGGLAVDAVDLLQCGATATQKVKEFTALLEEKLREDAKVRDKGGFMAELRAENDRQVS